MMSKKNKKNPNPFLGKLSPATNELLKNDRESLQENIVNHLEFSQAKDKYSANKADLYKSLVYTIRDRLFERWIATQQAYFRADAKRVYYISMEYMMGRTLCNALLNLGISDEMYQALWELGINMEELQEVEYDAGLGNGGLGRLAACYLDSMATLALPAYGYGIRYEYGIFTQNISNGWQVESPDDWLRYGNPWEIERSEYIYIIKFNGEVREEQDKEGEKKYQWINTDNIVAVAFDTPVPGYKNNTVNNFRLWTAKSSRDFNLEFFNSGDYEKAVEDKISSEVISKVLYPRDDFIEGRELRLKQEYFLVSATLQDIIRRFKKQHDNNFDIFPDKVAIQLNDTHPTLAIPELMRLLIDEEDMDWEKAWDICVRTFAYTNHTVLPEALETWRVYLLERLLPRHMQIIYEINYRFLNNITRRYSGDVARIRRMSIIKESQEKRVRMANLAIVGSHSVNGVAELHTEIIKSDLFHDFYDYFPERFNNKTNGITQRRWLKLANPELSKLVSNSIGDDWITDLNQMKKIETFLDDTQFLEEWRKIKKINKEKLADYIKSKLNISVNPDSIFDCQIKRIHEYKRQLLNALHAVTHYNRIRSGQAANDEPRTIIFSGKAAPAYHTAKVIIKLINCIADTINNDPDIGDRLKIVFIPNYSVSLAELIIPAADLSEQISTAGMEASGTGNMKFALNGALTIGTLDGANVEIKEAVGDDNIFIFGLTAEEVRAKRSGGYTPRSYYENNTELKTTLGQIAGGSFCKEDPNLFKQLTDMLLDTDYFMVLADYKSYIQTQEKINALYKNPDAWTRKAIINAANMGNFSSDRSIAQYASEIWNVDALPIKFGAQD